MLIFNPGEHLSRKEAVPILPPHPLIRDLHAAGSACVTMSIIIGKGLPVFVSHKALYDQLHIIITCQSSTSVLSTSNVSHNPHRLVICNVHKLWFLSKPYLITQSKLTLRKTKILMYTIVGVAIHPYSNSM